MVDQKSLTEATGITIVFIASISAVVFLQNQYGNENTTIKPIFVAIGILPILFYLIATGRLETLRGAGFEFVLRQQANRTIAGVSNTDVTAIEDEAVGDIAEDEVHPKETIDELNQDNDPSVLCFEIGRRDFYALPAVNRYLEDLSESLDYILFTKTDGTLKGHMKFKDFKDLVGKLDGDIIDEIESGTILTRSKMKKKCIAVDSSNSEALDKMEQEDINELAVLDSSEQFVGIVTQENLVRKLLTE